MAPSAVVFIDADSIDFESFRVSRGGCIMMEKYDV